ncbi:MAG: hypothetical protein LBF97_06640, partial [Elusimicrobiota bacterium]|nr:hypothetical protein [Elusimicrobiota bacterium]
KKLTENDLNILKERTKKYEIFKKERKSDRCFSLGLYEFLGLGFDYSEKYLEYVLNMKLSDINLEIENLLCLDKFVISIVE